MCLLHTANHVLKQQGLQETEDVVVVLVIVGWSIPFIEEVWTNVALHLMEQVQVVDQFMEYCMLQPQH
jgi:hypothetical protein